MQEKTKEQIKWFTFELLRIRMNPELVDGKYNQPIIFNLKTIKDCEDPYFRFTAAKTPNVFAKNFLREIGGYYANKYHVSLKASDLSFNKIKNRLKIYGYTTAILKGYLKDECNSLPSIFDTYKKNDRFYVSFVSKETSIEISGDVLTAFRMLRAKCYDENIYTTWDFLYEKMERRRHLLRERNLNNVYNTRTKQIDYIYQVVLVKLPRLLASATGDSDFNERNIIAHKYGGNYRLAL